MTPPTIEVPRRVDPSGDDPLALDLAEAARLPPFVRMDGSPVEQATEVRVAWTDRHLHVEFLCEDRDAWGTLALRDDPLWTEEVVELFVAPGEEAPREYYEIEISPRGGLFDARVANPDLDRTTLAVDTGWNCEGLLFRVDRLVEREDWRARLALPWNALALDGAPRTLRANFYRVERPRDGEHELSAWSPTASDPPDFHRPRKFGYLRLADFV